MAEEKEGRRSMYKAVMGERKDRDGFLVCWDGDKGRPGGQIILLWWWRWQEKENCGEGAGYRAEGGEGGVVKIRKLRKNKRRILVLDI